MGSRICYLESVTKQRNLPGLPSTIFATAKRQAQVRIRKIQNQLRESSACGYAELFKKVLPAQTLSKIDPTIRHRHYGALPLLWAWIAQIIEVNASCSKAVANIQSWSHQLGIKPPASDTSGYCKARQRLSQEFLENVHRHLVTTLNQRVKRADQWHGHLVKAFDGTSVTLIDTDANQSVYPQHGSQKPGCGFPIMGMVGLVDLSHGGVIAFETCTYKKHDLFATAKMVPLIQKGDVVLADRAFCSYELIARLTHERQGHIVMRLHQGRARKLDWSKGKKLGPHQRLVIWKKPTTPPPGSELTQTQWKALPAEMTLRYLKVKAEDRAGNIKEMIIVTDLLDPKNYPMSEIAELYHERWDIELKFRELKTTLKMEEFRVKSPEMAQKTLCVMMIAYNLLRLQMQEAAHLTGGKVRGISFEGVRQVVTSWQERFRFGRDRSQAANASARRGFLARCCEQLLTLRPGRREPRALKRRPKNYQLLTSHRSTFQEVLHRETFYRKTSRNHA